MFITANGVKINIKKNIKRIIMVNNFLQKFLDILFLLSGEILLDIIRVFNILVVPFNF